MERDNGGLRRYSLIVVVFIEIGTAFSDGWQAAASPGMQFEGAAP